MLDWKPGRFSSSVVNGFASGHSHGEVYPQRRYARPRQNPCLDLYADCAPRTYLVRGPQGHRAALREKDESVEGRLDSLGSDAFGCG